jgi:hypothetical protein
LGYEKDTKVKNFKHPIEKSGKKFNQKEIEIWRLEFFFKHIFLATLKDQKSQLATVSQENKPP